MKGGETRKGRHGGVSRPRIHTGGTELGTEW